MLLRGFVGSVLVLVGGLGVSTLPGSTPLLRSGLLVAVRDAEAGRMASLALVMLGLGLVAAQWLTLCRHVVHVAHVDPGAVARREAVLLTRRATVVWSAPLLLAPPLFSRDGWSYAAQGAMARVGVSPYEHGPGVLHGPITEAVDPRWLDTVTPYGPLPVWLGSLGAEITGNPWLLVVGHRLVALAGLLLLAWAVPRLATWSGVEPALASAVALASPLMLANGVGGLHNDLLMVGLMAAALVVAGEHGWLGGALLGGAAAAVKAPGGLVCLGVVLVSLPVAAGLTSRLARLVAVAVVSTGFLLGLGVATGLGAGWVAGLTVPGSVATPLSVTTLLGGALDRVAALLGLGLGEAALLELVRSVGTVVALAVAGWVALRAPTGDRAGALRAVAVVLGVVVLLSPVVHLWYLLWLVPFLAVLDLPRAGRVAVLAVSIVAGIAAPLDSSLHGAYLAIALGSMLLLVLVPLLLLTRSSRERLGRITARGRVHV